jgi:large subunit ribosomal protein L9
MIEVILLERIERLGQLGQVVKVRPGFARNFLLPQKKALRATKANLELFEKQREELESKNAALRTAAEVEAKKLEGITLVVIRQASEMGQLFGSVSARDVADSAKDANHKIERSQIQIVQPIKELGLFPVKVKLHPEVSVTITINVARSPEEAVVQAEKHAAVKSKADKAAEAPVEAPVAEEAAPAPAEEGEEKPKAKKAKAKKEDKADEAEEPKAKKSKAKKEKAE